MIPRRMWETLVRWYEQRSLRRAKKIILGGLPQLVPGWAVTNRDIIDVTVREDFLRYWRPGSRLVFCAEHVWEHLESREAEQANANCFEFLKPGGVLRLAVPDGLHPDPDYVDHVKPGGAGAGAEEHKVLYTHKSLVSELSAAGFAVRLLEYWDEAGRFHFHEWSDDAGRISRSSRYDSRNLEAPLSYTSLIVDAVKPD